MAATRNGLAQSPARLASGADAADQSAESTVMAATPPSPSPEAIARASHAAAQSQPTGCSQCITMAFFFDGTGNNMDADTPTDEHSNVARLFRAHPIDYLPSQTYRRYIPGIGTYFRDVGDPGGTSLGKGMGRYGQVRLDWAFKELATVLQAAEARAANPSNRIVSVRLSVFGFSRGATLARAFCRDLQKSCAGTRGHFKLKAGPLGGSGISLRGGYPIEVYFLGLFDTVASVGLPMSANNEMTKRRNGFGWRDGVGDGGYGRAELDLQMLAFGEPGADPAPGVDDGHADWAKDLRIVPLVSTCLHLVAAHEIRNSFPLDSARQGRSYPPGVTEMIYPGVHSDVGGGYRHAESGRYSVLSIVPLRVMAQAAIGAGVPLYGLLQLPTSAQQKDFALDATNAKYYADMMSHWQAYMKPLNSARPLGAGVLAHMAVYWRYRLTVALERSDPTHAAKQGRGGHARTLTTEQQTIQSNEKGFAAERATLTQEARDRDIQYDILVGQRQMAEDSLQEARNSAAYDSQVPALEQQVNTLKQKEDTAHDVAQRAHARLDTAANDSGLIASLDEYDAWLLEDAELLYRWHRKEPARRMRPHYKAIAEAYEEVVIKGQRMPSTRPEYIFFNLYVHDSLAGFATDNTRPSDPRVLYVGGDLKNLYAAAEPAQADALA